MNANRSNSASTSEPHPYDEMRFEALATSQRFSAMLPADIQVRDALKQFNAAIGTADSAVGKAERDLDTIAHDPAMRLPDKHKVAQLIRNDTELRVGSALSQADQALSVLRARLSEMAVAPTPTAEQEQLARETVRLIADRAAAASEDVELALAAYLRRSNTPAEFAVAAGSFGRALLGIERGSEVIREATVEGAARGLFGPYAQAAGRALMSWTTIAAANAGLRGSAQGRAKQLERRDLDRPRVS